MFTTHFCFCSQSVSKIDQQTKKYQYNVLCVLSDIFLREVLLENKVL